MSADPTGFSAVHLQTRQSAQLHVVLLLRACETCSDAGEDRCAEGTKLWVGLAQDYWTILNPKVGRKDSSVLKSALSIACWSQSPADSSVLADHTTFRSRMDPHEQWTSPSTKQLLWPPQACWPTGKVPSPAPGHGWVWVEGPKWI